MATTQTFIDYVSEQLAGTLRSAVAALRPVVPGPAKKEAEKQTRGARRAHKSKRPALV